MNNSNSKRVLVGLSGGVDSAAAAYILKEKGYEVIGITFNLIDEYNEDTLNDSKRIAEKLNISHFIYDYKEIFNKKVIRPFIDEYLKGSTPNPCLSCNKTIKFGLFYDLLKIHDAGFIATGHYLKKSYDFQNKIYSLSRPENLAKDQTYLMYFLDQWKLAHTLFPLGDIENKEKAKEIVSGFDIEISTKRESVNICFTDGADYRTFIETNTDIDTTGEFVDINGKILGRHKGIYNFTIGQKKCLGLDFDEKFSVVKINGNKNEIVLGDDELTYYKILIAKEVNIINPNLDVEKSEYTAKICQWGYFLKCKLYKMGKSKFKVIFSEKVRAITLGQSIVFYDNMDLVGGGIIESIIE